MWCRVCVCPVSPLHGLRAPLRPAVTAQMHRFLYKENVMLVSPSRAGRARKHRVLSVAVRMDAMFFTAHTPRARTFATAPSDPLGRGKPCPMELLLTVTHTHFNSFLPTWADLACRRRFCLLLFSLARVSLVRRCWRARL